MSFRVGDRVKWTSQAAGHTKTKEGEVVLVVPAGYLPNQLPEMEGRRSPCDTVTPRNHESYIVKVKNKHQSYYWPRVSQLQPLVIELPRVVVEISGGNCQATYSNFPVRIDVLDWDNLAAEEEEAKIAIDAATDLDTKKALIAAFKSAEDKAKEILKGVEHVW